jgi:hypothetical protein
LKSKILIDGGTHLPVKVRAFGFDLTREPLSAISFAQPWNEHTFDSLE